MAINLRDELESLINLSKSTLARATFLQGGLMTSAIALRRNIVLASLLMCVALPYLSWAQVQVLSATYGANCSAPTDNAKDALSAACNGSNHCDYTVDFHVLGDPAPGCAKTFVAQWACTAGAAPRSITLAPEAGFGSHAVLVCNHLPIGALVPQVPPPAHVPPVNEVSRRLNVEASLTASSPLPPNTPVTVTWKLTNETILRSSGTLSVALDNKPIAVQRTLPQIDLPPQGMAEGQFSLPQILPGDHTVSVRYSRYTGGTLNVPDGPTAVKTTAQTEDGGSADVSFHIILDQDLDGIDDHEEKRLLETYRPYFKFSTDGAQEHYNPTDVLWYISHSNLMPGGNLDDSPIFTNATLAADPFALLSANVQDHDHFCTRSPAGEWACNSDLTKNARRTNYRVNPLENVGGEGDYPGRHGNPDWSFIKSKGNVGLYGHVVPDAIHHLIKIEYWQFFGYNNANQLQSYTDHEGDWTTVQLLYDPNGKTIVSVTMYAHGREIPFSLGNIKPIQITDNGGLSVAEYRDPVRYNISDINMRNRPAGEDMCKQNLLRVFTGASGTEFHPVVYIEYGAHEFWPSEHWVFIEVIGGIDYHTPAHNGLSYAFLTATPPNLGEVEHPLAENSAAKIILRFNGLWGTWSKSNEPPQGPPLHNQWTWPADSSIRWQLPQDLGN